MSTIGKLTAIGGCRLRHRAEPGTRREVWLLKLVDVAVLQKARVG